MCLCYIFIIHSLTKEHLSCYQLLGIVNREAKNITEQECIEFNVESFGPMNRDDIVGSQVFTCSFWGIVHIHSHSNCTHLQFYQ